MGQGRRFRLRPGVRAASPPPVVHRASLNLPSLESPRGHPQGHLEKRLRAGSWVKPPEPEPRPLPLTLWASPRFLKAVMAIKSQCLLACRTVPSRVPPQGWLGWHSSAVSAAKHYPPTHPLNQCTILSPMGTGLLEQLLGFCGSCLASGL